MPPNSGVFRPSWRAGCTTDSTTLTCTWVEAKAYCASLALGGLSGWRLPAVTELSTIVDFTVTSGATIDATAFPNTPADDFWTSSPSAGYSGYEWVVSFIDGALYSPDVDVNDRVRCVR